MDRQLISITQKLTSKSFIQRASWVKFLLIIIFAIVIGRALYLQIIKRSEYEKIAAKQWNHSVSVNLRRGPIFDADNNLLAVSLPLDSTFAIPDEVEKLEDTARKLADLLDLSYENTLKKLKADVSFVWIRRNIVPARSEKLRAEGLKGIHFLKEYQRFYPLGTHAAQLLGFSGIDSQGLEGVEYQFNKHLMDNSGKSQVWNYFYESPKLKPLSGGSLQLTIRSTIQYMVEKELRKAVKAMDAKNGVAIVMESQTGDILALANIPDYDPNNFDQYPSARYFNRAVSATYEPGSTFKIITVAAALENELIKEKSYFNCEEGEYQIQDRVIHDVAKHGWLSIQEIVQKSSNICAAKIGQRIPKPLFYKMIHEFGFGAPTGIDLPGEVSGKVHNYETWSDTDVATMSFGHTISATPIQVLTAINTVATGGLRISPNIIKEVSSSNGEVLRNNLSDRAKRIIKPETAEVMKDFMITVTQKGGTGNLAALKDIQVAGKTGTSRKFDSRKGEYSKTNHISSFIGFLPADKPLLTILVVLDEPQKQYLYSKGAAPVFRKIAEHAIRFYEDRQAEDYEKPGPITNQELFTFSRVNQSTDMSNISVSADLKWMTLREVMAYADTYRLNLEIKGTGRVRKVELLDSKTNRYRVSLK